tara:strand:- start:392 stop:988 length:597 start_codon:yes stop_codon:yes gene_type:complete
MQNIIFKIISNLPVVFIQDFYSKEELDKIMTELHYFTDENIFRKPGEPFGPGTAIRDGIPLKDGKGLHLDGFYSDRRSESNILQINRKLFSKEVVTLLEGMHTFFRYIAESSEDNTKIHFFNQGNHYKKHIDSTTVTAISYFHDLPKSFTGGDLIIESQLHLPCLNNSLVIFPSILWHEVTPVVGTGRYAMSQFISMA